VLVWAPGIPIGLGVGGALVIVSGQKATGIGVAAYSLTELFVVCGVGAILITQVTALVFLVRAFSAGHWVRSLFSVLSICLSGIMLILVGFFLWISRRKHPSF
jgi:hypothetical protein